MYQEDLYIGYRRSIMNINTINKGLKHFIINSVHPRNKANKKIFAYVAYNS